MGTPPNSIYEPTGNGGGTTTPSENTQAAPTRQPSCTPPQAQDDWQVVWLGKGPQTFSDASTAVRRQLWQDWIFAWEDHRDAFAKLPRPLQETLLSGLAPAA